MKNLIKNIFILLISIVISYIISYYFLIDKMKRIMVVTQLSNITINATLIATIFTVISSIINRRVNKINIHMIMLLYFIMVMSLTFFRYKYETPIISINPFNIFNEFNGFFYQTLFILIGNIVVYIPLGVYIRYRVKISNLQLFIGFIIFILIIESIQCLTLRGVFDINDIITNTLGFTLGNRIRYLFK